MVLSGLSKSALPALSEYADAHDLTVRQAANANKDEPLQNTSIHISPKSEMTVSWRMRS
jgi:hypothetical protein